MIKCYGEVQVGAINCLEITENERWMITASSSNKNGGFLKMWLNSSKSYKKHKSKISPTNDYFFNMYENHGKIHETAINSVALTPDSKYMFTAGGYYEVLEQRQFDQDNQQLIRDFSTCYISGSIDGELISSNMQENQINEYEITSVRVSPCGKYLFTSDGVSYLRQWSIDSNDKDIYLHSDYGKNPKPGVQLQEQLCSKKNDFLQVSDDFGSLALIDWSEEKCLYKKEGCNAGNKSCTWDIRMIFDKSGVF